MSTGRDENVSLNPVTCRVNHVGGTGRVMYAVQSFGQGLRGRGGRERKPKQKAG